MRSSTPSLKPRRRGPPLLTVAPGQPPCRLHLSQLHTQKRPKTKQPQKKKHKTVSPGAVFTSKMGDDLSPSQSSRSVCGFHLELAADMRRSRSMGPKWRWPSHGGGDKEKQKRFKKGRQAGEGGNPGEALVGFSITFGLSFSLKCLSSEAQFEDGGETDGQIHTPILAFPTLLRRSSENIALGLYFLLFLFFFIPNLFAFIIPPLPSFSFGTASSHRGKKPTDFLIRLIEYWEMTEWRWLWRLTNESPIIQCRNVSMAFVNVKKKTKWQIMKRKIY